jgi:hypothetical protein
VRRRLFRWLFNLAAVSLVLMLAGRLTMICDWRLKLWTGSVADNSPTVCLFGESGWVGLERSYSDYVEQNGPRALVLPAQFVASSSG